MTDIAPSRAAAAARIVHLDGSHARALRRIAAVIGVTGLAMSAMMVLFANTSEVTQYVTALAPAAIGAAFVTVVGLQRERIRLRLTEEGIEYHAFGAALRARWEDMVALAHVEHGPFAGLGVTVRRVGATPGPFASRVWRLVGIRAPTHAIPLSPFMGAVRGSWLEMELRRRVPTLQEIPTRA